MSRYSGRETFFNRDELYESTFDEREVNGVTQYSTPILKHPTKDQIASLRTVPHVWKTGDKYFKLAFDHYGDPKLWWVLAWFNKKPTESSLKYGDVIYVPHPIDRVLTYLGV